MRDDEAILRCAVCSKFATEGQGTTRAVLPGLDGRRRMQALCSSRCLAEAVAHCRAGKVFPLREYFDRLEAASDELSPEDEERAYQAYRARGEGHQKGRGR